MTWEETRPFAPDAVAVVTKESITRFSASNLHPAESCRLIREGAEQAVRRVAGDGMRTPELDRPATLDLEFQTGDMAEVATWARGAERTGERSVRIPATTCSRCSPRSSPSPTSPARPAAAERPGPLPPAPTNGTHVFMQMLRCPPERPRLGPRPPRRRRWPGRGADARRPRLLHRGPDPGLPAGADVLAAGGSALDAVCATVEQLEDDPLFNAGRGAALTAAGTAELDACVMTGDGRAGAITACRYARNPVLAARKVMEETSAVLLVAPSEADSLDWELATVPPEYFLTPGPPAAAAQRAGAHARGVPARHGRRGGARRARAGWQPRRRPAGW